jgi:hypothetical protein
VAGALLGRYLRDVDDDTASNRELPWHWTLVPTSVAALENGSRNCSRVAADDKRAERTVRCDVANDDADDIDDEDDDADDGREWRCGRNVLPPTLSDAGASNDFHASDEPSALLMALCGRCNGGGAATFAAPR